MLRKQEYQLNNLDNVVSLVQVHAFMLWCTCVPLCQPFSKHVAKPTQNGYLSIYYKLSKK